MQRLTYEPIHRANLYDTHPFGNNECHDFRRIAAITYRDKRRADGEPLTDANEETKDFLRHARFSVTKRYLRNRKLKFVKKPRREYGKRLTNAVNEGIIDVGSGRMTDIINSPIENPIEQKHTGKGVSSAVLHYDADLNNRQKELLNKLPDYDSRVTVPKNSVNMTDLATLTAKTGVEFAMFTKGGERLIIRGNEQRVNVNTEFAAELNAMGYRWSGHTHPIADINNLFASEGDYTILNQFKQQYSAVYNSTGNFRRFEKR